MLEGGLAFSFNSLASGALCAALGAYVFVKNPYLKGSQAFIVLMFFVALNGIVEFLMINAPDEGTARAFARMMLFLSICAGASLMYLACHLPYDRAGQWIVRHKRSYFTASLVCAAVPAMLSSRVDGGPYGWWASVDAAFYVWLAVALAYCTGAAAVVLAGFRKDRGERTRGQYNILLVGVAILPAYGVLEIVANVLRIGRPPLLSLAVLSTAVVFAIALFKHGLFAVEPVREEFAGTGAPLPPAGGRCVLVAGKEEGAAYRMMLEDLALGGRGMLISRLHPERVREMFGLTRTPIIWLSTLPGPDRIDPASLSMLQHTIVDFLQRGSGSVVLLDGLEYLLAYHRPEKVLRFIYDVRDAAAISGSRFIVPVDPEVLESRNLAFLEREFEVVGPDGLPVREAGNA